MRFLPLFVTVWLLVWWSWPFLNLAAAYPKSWSSAARCIRQKESGSRWHLVDRPYFGAYQFVLGTWRTHAPAAFPRRPDRASPRQQTFVAFRVWKANGDRWGGSQWPNSSRACGVR